MPRSTGKQFRETAKSVFEEEKERKDGNDLQKRKRIKE